MSLAGWWGLPSASPLVLRPVWLARGAMLSQFSGIIAARAAAGHGPTVSPSVHLVFTITVLVRILAAAGCGGVMLARVTSMSLVAVSILRLIIMRPTAFPLDGTLLGFPLRLVCLEERSWSFKPWLSIPWPDAFLPSCDGAAPSPLSSSRALFLSLDASAASLSPSPPSHF